MSAEALREIPMKLEIGQVNAVPPLVANGYVMGLVTVTLLAAEASAAAKDQKAAAPRTLK